MGSSLPNHDAKDQKNRHNRDREKKKEKKEKEKPMADCKLAHKYIEITTLYDAWTISIHDACSNAVRISSIAL